MNGAPWRGMESAHAEASSVHGKRDHRREERQVVSQRQQRFARRAYLAVKGA